MSKSMYGGPRTKTAREAYVEQLPYGRGLTPYMNKKRKTFTQLNSASDTDLGYLSTPEYLRKVLEQTSIITSPSPIEMLSANVPRTKSASELTPRNNLNRSTSGNPKYKAQEDYYDEIHSLKKEMKTLIDDNSNLRAKLRRLEEDNTRKRKEIDTLYEPNKDGDLRRTLSGSTTDRTNNIPISNVVMSLKQRLFRLESQLKEKETTIDEMRSDPKWTKSTELEIQNRALFGELDRQKVERLNYIQHNDYVATVDEEKKNAVRKLDSEKRELTAENKSLKKRIEELENGKHGEPLLSARPTGDNNKNGSDKLNDDLIQECQTYKTEIEQTKKTLKKTERDRDRFQESLDEANENLEKSKRELDQYRKQFDQANETLEKSKRELDQYRKKADQPSENVEEIKRERDQFHRKLDQANQNLKEIERERDQCRKEFIQAEEEIKRLKRDPSPPISKPKRPESPPRSSRTESLSAHSRRPESPTRSTRPESPARSTRPESPTPGKESPRSTPSLTTKQPDRPTSGGASNDSALKIVQAALRGYLNRNEIDNPRGEESSPPPKPRTSPPAKKPLPADSDEEASSAPSRPRTPTPAKKPLPIDSDDDDIVTAPSTKSVPQYGNGNKRDSVLDKSSSSKKDLSTSKQSLQNDKTGSNNPLPTSNRESATKINRSISPTAVRDRPSSPQFGGSSSGSKQTLPYDRTKLGSGTRLPTSEQASASKPLRSTSPPSDSHRSSSPLNAKSGGSKETLPIDRTKLGAGNRVPTTDQASASKPLRSTSPPADSHRSSPPPNAKSGGSKETLPNTQNKLGPANRFPPSTRDSLSKPHRSPSPPTDSHRPTSPKVGSGGASKETLPNDRPKPGSGSGLTANDRDSSSKLQRPSSPSDIRPPASPENSHPSSQKSSAISKAALNNIQEDDDDDDVSAS